MAAPILSSDNYITVVSGLPRSGTSLMMQMLAAGGFSLLTDEFRLPDESNPRGYFEFDPVKRLRVDRSWIKQARGRVVKIIHLLLRELPLDPEVKYRVVFMRRTIDEVLASQKKMLEREGKNSVDGSVLDKIYSAQLDQVERWLAGRGDISTIFIEHRDLFERADSVCLRLKKFFGGHLDAVAMQDAIDPSLYHQRMN